MQILLDTHIIIWLVENPKQLSQKVLDILTDKKTKIYYSLASIWELAIKAGIGRIEIDLSILLDTLKQNDIKPLQILETHIIKVKDLPAVHKDPFDRILIAQAISENLQLFTRDTILQGYSKKLVNLV